MVGKILKQFALFLIMALLLTWYHQKLIFCNLNFHILTHETEP